MVKLRHTCLTLCFLGPTNPKILEIDIKKEFQSLKIMHPIFSITDDDKCIIILGCYSLIYVDLCLSTLGINPNLPITTLLYL